MSFQDRLASQDASQLLLLGSSLSMVTMSAQKGIYNFPLFLFGIIAHEMHSSTVPFKQFLSLVVFSGIFDLLRLPSWSFFSISSIFAFLVLLLKIPVFLTCLAQLRERGGDLRFGYPTFQGLQSGAQNWTMPGPFGNAGAGQTTGSTAAPPGSFPSGGGFRLGGDEEEGQQQQGQGGPPPGPAPGRNGYQTIA